MPRFCNSPNTARVISGLRMTADSVSSSLMRSSGKPLQLISLRVDSSSDGSLNCRAETLTLTQSSMSRP